MAADMEGKVPVKVRHERSKRLRMLSDKKRRFFYEEFIGENRPILFEGKETDQNIFGFTDNYIKVVSPFQKGWVNNITTRNLSKVNADGLMESGEIREITPA